MQNMNIKVVIQMTGINENTLRAWERRYKVVVPERGTDGRRLYSKKDVDKILMLWKLVQKGYLIGTLAGMTLPQIKKLELDARTSENQSQTSALSKDAGVLIEQVHLNTILDSLNKFNLESIQYSLQKARFELSPQAIISDLILPLLREVGIRVAEGQLSIAQEHLLSSLLRDHLGNLYQSMSPYDYKKKLKSGKVLLTTREGDLHEFSILLAAILCRIHGFETYYLGPNMPVDDLAQACEQFKIDTVILGLASLPNQQEIISASDFIKRLDQLAPRKIQFLCGGTSKVSNSAIKSGRKLLNFSSIRDLDKFLSRHG
jgi:methanogenic corrinoid protein MtbC1